MNRCLTCGRFLRAPKRWHNTCPKPTQSDRWRAAGRCRMCGDDLAPNSVEVCVVHLGYNNRDAIAGRKAHKTS